MSLPIAIVGAGISGLTLASELKALGQPVVLLEAADRAGGVIRSEWQEGYLLEWGPNSFLDREPTVRRLAARLGITSRIRPAAPTSKRRYIFTRGALREVPGSPPALLRSDVLSVPGKLRVLLEPLSRRGQEGKDESVAAFGRRHVGSEATAVLVDAFQSGMFAGDMERLSVRSAFPRLWEFERDHRSLLLGLVRTRGGKRRAPASEDSPSGLACTFDGGLETLVRALAQDVGDALRLSARVTALERLDGTWRLSVEGSRPLEARHVVVATPTREASKVLFPLSSTLALELDTIPYAPAAVVHLGYRTGELPPFDGFGFLVPASERRDILGCIWASKSFPWRAEPGRTLLTVMVGGARQPSLVSLPDAELLALASGEVSRMMHLTAKPVFHRIHRWPRGIPQYDVGHGAHLARARTLCQQLGGISLLGNAYDGVGIADCVRAAHTLAGRLG
ncbi:MAG: protoporphyrinogen oxidase [Myxococcaceae bacterium]|nr:protoporphyrinogen oxidase [Myxococcaceae bacterium]MCI0669240.1 protoporphyrinogen oxidase [Myxococcaceae bacterium]